MKHYVTLFVAGYIILISSCGTYMPETEAIRLNAEGLAEINHGRYENAIDKFKQAGTSPVLSDNTKSTIYRNIAQAFTEIQEADSAIHYFKSAADIQTKNSYQYLINMADVELMQENTRSALSLLKRAYKLEPNDVAVNNSLGLIYLGTYGDEFKNPGKALSYNQKAYERNIDRNSQYVLALNHYELGQLDDAELHLETLNKLYPQILNHPLFLGLIKYQLDKKDEAEALWSKVLQADSGYRETIESYKW